MELTAGMVLPVTAGAEQWVHAGGAASYTAVLDLGCSLGTWCAVSMPQFYSGAAQMLTFGFLPLPILHGKQE